MDKYTFLGNKSMSHVVLILILIFVLSNTPVLGHPPGFDHCSSFLSAPDSPQTETTNAIPSFPMERARFGYFNSSSRGFPNQLYLEFQEVSAASTNGVLKIAAKLTLPSGYVDEHEPSSTNLIHRRRFVMKDGSGKIEFWLEGYWSESSGKLCMVGSTRTGLHRVPVLKAVLRLDSIRNSKTVASLVRGTMESLSSVEESDYFEPLSFFVFPTIRENYTFTLVSEYDYVRTPDDEDNARSVSLDQLSSSSFCGRPWWPLSGFYLEHARGCDPRRDCSPFGLVSGSVPKVMLIRAAGCLVPVGMRQRFEVLLKFSDTISGGFSWYFDQTTTLTGEGFWDGKKLHVSACRFLDAEKSMATARVGDCSTRLNLRFPSVLSLRKSSNIVGKIWTNKSVDDPGYFRMVRIRSSENYIPGQKYRYTEIDRARSLCSKEPPRQINSATYPDANSFDMNFDLEVQSLRSRIAWGYATPLTVGDQLYEPSYPIRSGKNLISISYKIGITGLTGLNLGDAKNLFATSSMFNEKLEISAEGIYDESTGRLCMVGCRNLITKDNGESMDCEILVHIQFPSVEETLSGSYVKGTMESTRNESHPLYFDQLELSSVVYSWSKAQILKWRMDLKIIMELATSTLSCVFIRAQLRHAKGNPQVLPSISFLMLLILPLGSAAQLIANCAPLLSQNDIFSGGSQSGEVSQVLTGLADLVAILFQCRLLQLAFVARSKDENQKSLWLAETGSFTAYLLFYASGIFILLRTAPEEGLNIESFAQLAINSILLPQIVLNILSHSKEKTLLRPFYIGLTFIHTLEHVWNLYASDTSSRYDSFLSFYASDTSSRYDSFLSFLGVLLAVVVHLQQRSGAAGCSTASRKPDDKMDAANSVVSV